MGIPTPLLVGAGIGAVGSALAGRSPIAGAALGAAGGGLYNAFNAGAFTLPGAKATSAASFINPDAVAAMKTPTMGEIGGANLYSSGVAPVVQDASSAMPLMTSTPTAQGGLSLMPGEHDWMKGGFDFGALQGINTGRPQQSQAPSAQGAGVSKGQAPDANAVSSLLATIKMPEEQQRLNLFWG